jgi:phosphoglycolate phosphatase
MTTLHRTRSDRSGFRNIIFDFDGTITDSRDDIAGAQLWVLGQLGITSRSKEDLYQHIGKPLHETFVRLLPPAMHHRIPDAARMYAEYYPSRSLITTTLFPGVRETLEVLCRAGKQLAVASTKRGPGIRRATDHFGITDRFVQLQGSDDLPFKPDPFIITKIIKDQGWEPNDTLMVGDTDNDILAGRNAGIATCAVTYGSLEEQALKALEPDFIIHNFPEIISIAGQ